MHKSGSQRERDGAQREEAIGKSEERNHGTDGSMRRESASVACRDNEKSRGFFCTGRSINQGRLARTLLCGLAKKRVCNNMDPVSKEAADLHCSESGTASGLLERGTAAGDSFPAGEDKTMEMTAPCRRQHHGDPLLCGIRLMFGPSLPVGMHRLYWSLVDYAGLKSMDNGAGMVYSATCRRAFMHVPACMCACPLCMPQLPAEAPAHIL